MNLGKIINVKTEKNQVKISFEKKEATFTIIREDIIRVFVSFFLEEYTSKAIEGEKSVSTEFEVNQMEGERPYNKLILLATPDEAEYVYFQDNGEDYLYKTGEYNLYKFHTDKDSNLTTELLHEGYTVYDEIKVLLV